MEVNRIQEMIETIGYHRFTPVRVTAVSITGTAVSLEVRLDYQTGTPVCCDEPGCYTPFLRPGGLARLAELLRVALGVSERPTLHLKVRCVFEPGYRFEKLDLGARGNWIAEYDYP